jgi:hypothetical protein
MYRYAFLLVAVAGQVGAAPEASDAARVAALVRQLGSESYAEREAAMAALDAAGEPALDALREAARGKDPEVRRRAVLLVRQVERRVEARKVLEPQRLRLEYKDVPLSEAVADFARKSGAAITLVPGRTKDADRKVTLDTGEVTFWEAFEKFCAAAGLAETVPPPAAGVPDAGPPVTSMVIIGRGGARPPADVMKPAREEKPFELTLGDGKPSAQPAHHAGALRVRAAPADRRLGELAVGLEVSAEARLQWQRAVGLRVERAVDEHGQALEVLPVQLKAPAAPVAMRGSVTINGTLIEPPADDDPSARLVPVRMRPGEKAASRLKELSGTITAQLRTAPEALVTVDDVLKASDRLVKGARGGAVRVVEARREEGGVALKVQVEPPPRGVSDRPGAVPLNATVIINGRRVGGNEDLLSALNFALVDEKGRPFRTVKATSTGRRVGDAEEYELTYQAEAGQGEAAKFVYTDRRTVLLDVPFVLKDVPLP